MNTVTNPPWTPVWSQASPDADVVCEHGTASDVHCCGCHHGFLFTPESCTCPPWDDPDSEMYIDDQEVA